MTSPLFNRAVAISAALALVYLFVISLGLAPALVPRLVARTQLGYRFVSYQNLCLLLLVLVATQHFARRPYRRDVIVGGLAVALTLSFTGMLLKVVHASTVRNSGGPWQTATQRLTVPAGFYYAGDYNISQDAAPQADVGDQIVVSFSPSAGKDFAAIPPVHLEIPTDSVVRSNVYLFPWNRIMVDALDTPRSYYRGREASLTSFNLRAGSHTIEYRFVPDPVWKLLRHISLAALSLWCIGLSAWVLIWQLRRWRFQRSVRLGPT